MDPQVQKMIDRLPEKTGRSLDAWMSELDGWGLDRHGQIVTRLKKEHDFGHGYANLVATTWRKRSQGAPDDPIAAQYAKKPQLRPLFDALMARLKEQDDLDFEVVPKKTAVALKRNRQFLYVQPTTKTRLDVGIQLKGERGTERLKARSGMTSHVVGVTSLDQIDDELIGWIRLAWERC